MISLFVGSSPPSGSALLGLFVSPSLSVPPSLMLSPSLSLSLSHKISKLKKIINVIYLTWEYLSMLIPVSLSRESLKLGVVMGTLKTPGDQYYSPVTFIRL